MAQQGKKKRPGGSSPAGKSQRPAKPSPGIQPGAKQPPRTAVGYGPQGSAIRRQSVAAKRPTGNNTTQAWLLGGAALVILAVIVVGFIWNRSNNQAVNDGYGSSKNGTASIDTGGIVTVAYNDPPVSLDIFEDPLCPFCGAFERQWGQQIAQLVDEGKISVNYHLLNFLDGQSGSGNYSTRASAALMCTAENLGSAKGVWASLHATLYSQDVQPSEGSTDDLTNDQLNGFIRDAATAGGLAADAPTVAAAQSCVNDGTMLETVKTSYDASAATLTQLTGAVRSPVIASNGTLVNVDDENWLTNLTS